MLLSIIVPAFNEETCLREILAGLQRSKLSLPRSKGLDAEFIVVDNESNDRTAEIARAFGATIVGESQHNIAKVRNTGATAARGDVLVFVDADVIVPEKLLLRVVEAMSDETCFGGAFDTDYKPKKMIVSVYLKFWRIIGKLAGMAQGAAQFYRRDTFQALKGFDETLYMGEDVDLFWRLRKLAKQQNGRVVFIDDLRVVPSTRRFDQWRA